MSVRIVRLGSPRTQGEGVRVGTVRRPPRGVPKTEYARRDFYDAWMPLLAPSPALLAQVKTIATDAQWNAFFRQYEREMRQPDQARLLDLLALLSHSTDFSVGCYCEDESRCHRSVLRKLLATRGAKLA